MTCSAKSVSGLRQQPSKESVDAYYRHIARLQIHYDVDAWEGSVYKYGLDSLREAGCNVDGLQFDSKLVIRGLIIDRMRGNLVKVDRFGYVITYLELSCGASCNVSVGQTK